MFNVKIFQSFFINLWKRLFWSPNSFSNNYSIDEFSVFDKALSKKEIERIIKMWKIKHYIIDIDSYSENKEQKTCCNSSEVIRKQITKKQFKKIMKIVGEENA
jgi:tRNA(Ile)-lysidine synthase TilS/MesJ